MNNLRVVKSEIAPTGEKLEVVRPMAQGTLSSNEVVNRLINQYDYKTANLKGQSTDVQAVAHAFPNYAQRLIRTYEGSTLMADTQQDLIGDRYLSEQIRRINEENKKKSILDKWGHLLYEGDQDYTPNPISAGYTPTFKSVPTAAAPVRVNTFILNNKK